MQEDSTDQILQALAKPSGPPGRRRFAAVIAVVAVALVLVALFGIGLVPRLNANRAIAEVAKDSLTAVNVVPAARGKAGTELTLPSTLQPVMEAPIYARTNGYVKRWLVDIGAKVKAGQLLAEIETPEVDRELKQAIANKGQVKANLDLARTTAERWQTLLKDKAVVPAGGGREGRRTGGASGRSRGGRGERPAVAGVAGLPARGCAVRRHHHRAQRRRGSARLPPAATIPTVGCTSCPRPAPCGCTCTCRRRTSA